jgi:hypothetical protein
MKVGAPASGIEVVHSMDALTPRHEDLKAGIWARGSFPPAAPVLYAITAATCNGRLKEGVSTRRASIVPGDCDDLQTRTQPDTQLPTH